MPNGDYYGDYEERPWPRKGNSPSVSTLPFRADGLHIIPST